MNLCTKAVILLLFFNRFEYSMAAADGGCQDIAAVNAKLDLAEKCACDRFGLDKSVDSYGLQKCVSDIPKTLSDKRCCASHYNMCGNVQTIRKYCNPNSEWTEQKRREHNGHSQICKPKPSKDLCEKYHKNVDKTCDEYKYSECEAYNWIDSLSDSPMEAPTPSKEVPTLSKGAPTPAEGTESPPEKDKPTTSGSFSSLSAMNGLVLLSVFPFILIIA